MDLFAHFYIRMWFLLSCRGGKEQNKLHFPSLVAGSDRNSNISMPASIYLAAAEKHDRTQISQDGAILIHVSLKLVAIFLRNWIDQSKKLVASLWVS